MEMDYTSEFESILSEAESHISEILTLHSVRSKEINHRIDKLVTDVETEKVFRLNDLQTFLQKSSELLLPLQTKIRNARHVYLKEQWFQGLLRKKSDRSNLEADLFPSILKSSYCDFQPLFSEYLCYFIRCQKPKILAFDQLIDLILERNKIELIPKEIEKPEIMFIDNLIDLTVFKDELISEANIFLNHKLDEHKHSLDFDTLICEALQEKKTKVFCNYLRLLIQIRVSIPEIDQNLHDYDFKVEVLPSLLSNSLFVGNNYQITRSVIP